jgi:F-type H+-transporting ATPase subunit delta
MATLDKVAYRYAKAFFDYLKDDAKKAEKVLAELRQFAALVAKNKELKIVADAPTFKEEERREIVKDIATKLKLSELTTRLLVVLSDLKRLGHTGAIADRLHQLFLEMQNVALLTVKTAEELDDSHKSKIEARFGKVLGKKVEARYEIDPSLIAGLRVDADGRTYDGSVDGWLTSFEERLVGGNV